ncbi:MAG: tRNA (adenosine(37)-N6)-threonylcarbamoyltransferase complex ATPase subunit type 1 TsaE [Spirochaetia bacterium]|nr:tRNA (adenosine(37)-N6)-threonylcarbamoyltransferase complex ATPase subunit type 1 TsaE [Spirochaetia bacterium]
MNSSATYTTKTVNQTLQLGKKIGNKCIPGSIISLRGPLGSGKTIIAKGVALAIGIVDPITSPTFTIINEYTGKIPLIHIDLYRIKSIEEFELLGAEELLFGMNITIIEWSELIDMLLPENAIRIEISIKEDSSRSFFVSGVTI